MMLWWLKSRRAREIAARKAVYEAEYLLAQKRRCRTVMAICDKYMRSPPKQLQTMDREILVTYQDLLRVWDVASRIEENL